MAGAELLVGLLRGTMRDIERDDALLCATRRSAGLPYLIQAIVSTEPTAGGRQCLKSVMTKLLDLAEQPLVDDTENNVQVHVLNVLRALYRDARLVRDMTSFVARGIAVALAGYTAQVWNVRNSSTLLLSALMTRVLGTPRAVGGDTRNNVTWGAFFTAHPTLYEELLARLEGGGAALYPALLLLAGLHPSTLEAATAASPRRASRFVGPVVACGASGDLLTRRVAARALGPLVTAPQMLDVVVELVTSLPSPRDQRTISHNAVHGALLQLHQLLLAHIAPKPADFEHVLCVLSEALRRCAWLYTRENPCLVTRSAYLDLAKVLMLLNRHDLSPDCMLVMDEVIADVCQNVEQSIEDCFTPGTPWISQLQESMTDILLTMLRTKKFRRDACMTVLLRHNAYEVRLRALQYIEETVTDIPLSTAEGNYGDSSDVTDLPGVDGGDPSNMHCATRVEHGMTGGDDDVARYLSTSHVTFNLVVMMVMGGERHSGCLAAGLEALHRLEGCGVFPWRGAAQNGATAEQEWGVEGVLQRLVALTRHPYDEVRTSSLVVSAAAVGPAYSLAAQSPSLLTALRAWVSLVTSWSGVTQSVAARDAAAHALVVNAARLLRDPDDVLGAASCVVAWRGALRLLRDENAAVRGAASRVVAVFEDVMTSDERALLSPGAGVQPELALRLVVTLAPRGLASAACLHALADWCARQDDDDVIEESELRLFDRSEMNTYCDEITFIRHVGATLRDFVMQREASGEPDGEFEAELQKLRSQYSGSIEDVKTGDIRYPKVDEVPMLFLTEPTSYANDVTAEFRRATLAVALRNKMTPESEYLHTQLRNCLGDELRRTNHAESMPETVRD